MKKLIKSTLAVTVLSFALISCGGETKTEEHNHEGHTHKHSEATAKYACPMKCEGEKTYDAAGECPICHMDLEEVK